jgi:hypothetical protein
MTEQMPPLRQRMIEGMKFRNLSPLTQRVQRFGFNGEV